MHRDASGRQLVERREVEVAEDDHGRGARDGRRRHDQEVGVAVGALAAQGGSLLDAEAVLLVDHHAAERAERHLLGEQGVGAHDQADATPAEAFEDARARPALHLAREELDPHVPAGHAPGALEVAQQRPHRGEVLLGQHLGRHHQRALMPALRGGQQRGHRHHGLARADVTLEQAVHREGARHVGDDDRQGLALRGRELVGQPGQEPGHQGPRDGAGDLPGRDVVVQGAGVHLEGPPAQHQSELQPEQLVEDQPAPGRRHHIERLGHVDGPEGLRAPPQVELVAPGGRQRVEELPGPAQAPPRRSSRSPSW